LAQHKGEQSFTQQTTGRGICLNVVALCQP
jgi:hypothetical protein